MLGGFRHSRERVDAGTLIAFQVVRAGQGCPTLRTSTSTLPTRLSATWTFFIWQIKKEIHKHG